MKDCLRKYLVEFIGTFFLVFTVLSVVFYSNPAVLGPIAIGFVLMVCVYAGGHISGGHYNPAVSFAAALKGALEWKQLIPYWVFQFLGGAAAVWLMSVYVVFPELLPTDLNFKEIIGGEFLFTFLLCYVVLLTATSKKTEGNSFFGFAIGSTVTVGAFVAGGTLCYGAFNPAVASSLYLFHSMPCNIACVTIAANLVAALCAALVFKFVDAE